MRHLDILQVIPSRVLNGLKNISLIFNKKVFNFFFLGDSHMFQSMLECSMISRSDTSGESGCRGGNGSMSLDPANNDPNVQKYACARCGRSYLHQVFFQYKYEYI